MNGGNHLSVSYRIMMDLFNVVLSALNARVRKLISTMTVEQKQKLKCVCLAGGMSMSKYVQYKVRQEFGRKSDFGLHVVVTERPFLAVVNGAIKQMAERRRTKQKKKKKLQSNNTKGRVSARVLKFTYGISCSLSLSLAERRGHVSAQHIRDHGFYCALQKKRMVGKCFAVFVKKGQKVPLNHVVTKRFSLNAASPLKAQKRNTVECKLYASDLKQPGVVTGRKSKQVANMTITIPNGLDCSQHSSIFKFHFAETILKITHEWEGVEGSQQSVTSTFDI